MSNWLPRLLGSTRDAAWREGAGATVRAGGYATLLLLALSIAGLGEVAHAANAKAAGLQSCAKGPVASSKTPRPGHYIALNRFDGRQEMIDALQPGVRGIQKKYSWRSLESEPGSYDFAAIEADLDLLAKRGARLVVFLEDKSFDGSIPVPPYLEKFILKNRQEGYTSKRWDPFVVDRTKAIIAAIGRAFDCHAGFEGLAVQESALGIEDEILNANGYSPLKYRDALIEVLGSAAEATPNSTVFWYMNFLRGGQKYIGDIASAVAASGVAMGGPDVLPDRASLVRRVYPYYSRFKGKMTLFNSMQYNSYRHEHTDPSYPTKYWTMEELFVFARDKLHVNYVFWTRKVTRKPADSYDWTDALPVIEATADFAGS